MKKRYSDRHLLGLTQQEIAMILNVGRSQYSHHEARKRDLPGTASLRLAEMILYMTSPEAKEFSYVNKVEDDVAYTNQVLGKRLEEKEFRLLALNRKINAIEEKLEKHKKAVELMGFLNSPTEIVKAVNPKALDLIETRAIVDFREIKSELYLLQIDQKLMQYETELLKKSLKKK